MQQAQLSFDLPPAPAAAPAPAPVPKRPILPPQLLVRWTPFWPDFFNTVSDFLVRRDGTTFSGDTEERDIKDDVETVEFGRVFGGGVQFGRMHVDGRYDWGISDFDTDKSDESSVNHRVWMVLAGYRF